MKRPLKSGLDYVRGSGWSPRMFTHRGATRWAQRQALRKLPRGFWHPIVMVTEDGAWRVSFGGQAQEALR